MTPTKDDTLAPWMIDILTKEEVAQIEKDRLVPLHIPLPMTKEEVVEESDIIEEEGRTIIEFDI